MDTTLTQRWWMLNEELAALALRSGRTVDQVRLCPASKTVPPEILQETYRLGQRCFGENRIQEAREKIPALPSDTEWHFIGGLQRNKARDAVRLFTLIHSVDSISLVEELARRAQQAGKVQAVLLELNMGGEVNKHGVEPEALPPLVEAVMSQSTLELRGFMTVAPHHEDAELVRPYFARLRGLRDQAEQWSGKKLPELSMGMSHDYRVAVLEGATLIRIGTALFGGRTYPAV